MAKKSVIVISLGGSLIVPPSGIDAKFLKRFSVVLRAILRKHRVVVVCGGGAVSREYIGALRGAGRGEPFVSLSGIESTKLNASLVAGFLGRFHIIPDSLIEVRSVLERDGVAVCGALGFQPRMTSDGDAAQIAEYLKADLLVNLTNVDGLYDRNPARKGAVFVPFISFTDFLARVALIDYKAGQHFVLDQYAAKVIAKRRIKTAILNGHKLGELKKLLSGKRFRGTVIYG